MLYHYNPATGEPGRCRAEQGKCPFEEISGHHPTEEAARQAYEAKQPPLFSPTLGPLPATYEPAHGTMARSIAARVTAHNSGQTVYEDKVEEDGVVSLRMSSWPRANEAIKGLLREGYHAEFGANDMGQWIHVAQKPLDSQVATSGELSWDRDSDSFTVEASELRGMGELKALKSSRTGETVLLGQPRETRDSEGEVLYWDYRPRFLEASWKVRVFND